MLKSRDKIIITPPPAAPRPQSSLRPLVPPPRVLQGTGQHQQPISTDFDPRPYLLVILALAALARLVAVGAPLLDAAASAQATTAAIARNFHDFGYNPLHPMVNWGGATAGYVDSAFPLYSYLVALLYVPLGVHEWLGRFVSLLFAVAAVLLTYRLVARLSGALTALYAALFLAISPLAVYFGRAFLPDSTALCLAVAALYAFVQYADTVALDDETGAAGRPRILALALAAALAALASLTNAANLLILVPLGYIALIRLRGLDNVGRQRLALELAAFGIVAVGMPFWWYGYAHTLGDSGLAVAANTRGFDPAYIGTLLIRLFDNILTSLGAILFVVGISRPARLPFRWFYHCWLLGLAAYFLLAAPTVAAQEYALLPFAPLAAAFVGMGAAQVAAWLQAGLDMLAARRNPDYADRIPGAVRPAIALALLVPFLIIASASYARLRPMYDLSRIATRDHIAPAIAEAVPPDRKTIIAAADYPELFYYANRQGWPIASAQLPTLTAADVEQMHKAGASYFVTTDLRPFAPTFLKDMLASYKLARGDQQFIIFALDQPGDPNALFFPETGASLSQPYRGYWEQHGGLASFGYPIATPRDVTDANPPYQVQWFERARMEYHPERGEQPDAITLGNIGTEYVAGKHFPPAPPATNCKADCAYFAQTGHTISGPFLQKWREGGGLSIFGYPLSEQVSDINPASGKVITTQWFERAHMQCLPAADGSNPCASIALDLLGQKLLNK